MARHVSRTRTLLLAAATLVTAFFAGTSATVNFLHVKLPDQALAIDGDDPVALVRSAQGKLASGQGLDGGADAVFDIVRRSVLRSPINPAALRLSGVVSSANADLEGVRGQMRLSDRMGRRDLAAQLWLIEDAVLRNEVDEALSHYDTALRVRESSRALLYPVLTNALNEPIIRERFVRFFREQPDWLVSFLGHAVSNTRQPTAIAQLARQAGGFPAASAYSSLDTQLMRVLVESGRLYAAANHYRTTDGADPAILTSLALTAQSTAEPRAPVTWQPYSIPGVQPYVVGTAGDAVEIESDIEPGFAGPVVRKLMQLTPGRYRLRSALRAEGQGPRDAANWSLVCVRDGERSEIYAKEAELAASFGIEGNFTVPAGCPAQMLTLSVRTNPAPGTISLVLAEASLAGGGTRAATD